MKFTKKFKENAALVVLGVVLFWGLTNYDKFFRLLGVMIGVLKPVIFGCIIAFILNVPATEEIPAITARVRFLDAQDGLWYLTLLYPSEGQAPGSLLRAYESAAAN